MPSLPWIDAHLDLAYLAEVGRDMTRPAEALTGLPAPAAVTLPSLLAAGIEMVFATIFVQKRIRNQPPREDVDGPWCYGDPEEAHLAALRQVSIYLEWLKSGWITFPGMPTLQALAKPDRPRGAPKKPLQVILLLEGAAPIRSSTDLQSLYGWGLRIVSLAWAEGSPWSGGDHTAADVTSEGRRLLAEIDRLDMIHDVSHLSEKAFWTVLNETSRPKIASHSNCRALLPGKQFPERHLSDPQIRALAAAGGVIGLNLFSPFLTSSGRATVADALRHIKHIADLTGRDDILGLGSDMEGGFSTHKLPLGLEHPAQLVRLADALSAAGFSDEAIHRFAHQNWRRLLKTALQIGEDQPPLNPDKIPSN